MFGKVRPTAHRGNGSELPPKAGLSEGRIALVQRYMLDAEEAEAGAQAAAERPEERPDAAGQATTAFRNHSGRAAVEEGPIRRTAARRRAEKLLSEEETAWADGRPDAKEEARALKALARADERAAKEAAQRIAALEKKEARERKALAKAAARRRTR
jgi:colicin import membrane protein